MLKFILILVLYSFDFVAVFVVVFYCLMYAYIITRKKLHVLGQEKKSLIMRSTSFVLVVSRTKKFDACVIKATV